jgi:hypothetical protein
MRLL